MSFVGLFFSRLKLAHGPSHEVLVDPPCQQVQLGAVEGPVVVDPASNLRIGLLGEPGQVRSTASDEMPLRDLSASRLFAAVLMAGEKFLKTPLLPLGPAAPKGVTEEIEAGVLHLASALRVLAVHDLRLVGVPRGSSPLLLGPSVSRRLAPDRACSAPHRSRVGLAGPGPKEPQRLLRPRIHLVKCSTSMRMTLRRTMGHLRRKRSGRGRSDLASQLRVAGRSVAPAANLSDREREIGAGLGTAN